MLFAETVEKAGSVFVDTAPLIYFIEAHPVYGPLMKQLVGALSKGRIAASSSVITLAEVLPAPLRAGNEKLARMFTQFLKHAKNLTISITLPMSVHRHPLPCDVKMMGHV